MHMLMHMLMHMDDMLANKGRTNICECRPRLLIIAAVGRCFHHPCRLPHTAWRREVPQLLRN